MRSLYERPRPAPGLVKIFNVYRILQPDGSSYDVGRFFRVETFWMRYGAGVRDSGRPLAPVSVTAVRGMNWYYADGAGYSVMQYDSSGNLGPVFAYPGVPPPMSPRTLRRYLRDLQERAGKPLPYEQEILRQPLHEHMPGYDRLLIDKDGNVWARPAFN